MNTRISIIPTVLATAAMLISASALARPPEQDDSWRMGPPGAEHQLARLNRELGLSDEQSLQMLGVLQAAEADHEAFRNRIMEESGPEICALRQNTEADILDILTPEQAELFLQHKAERLNQGVQGRERSRARFDCPE